MILLGTTVLGCAGEGPAGPGEGKFTIPTPGTFNGRLSGSVDQSISGWAKSGAFPGTTLPRILYLADPDRQVKVEVIQRQEGFQKGIYNLDDRNPYLVKELDVRVLLEGSSRTFFETRGTLTVEEVTEAGVKGVLSMGMDEEPLAIGEVDATIEVRFDAEFIGDAKPFPIFTRLP